MRSKGLKQFILKVTKVISGKTGLRVLFSCLLIMGLQNLKLGGTTQSNLHQVWDKFVPELCGVRLTLPLPRTAHLDLNISECKMS